MTNRNIAIMLVTALLVIGFLYYKRNATGGTTE